MHLIGPHLQVHVDDTTKLAAYLVFTLQTKFYTVLYGVFNVFYRCFVQEFWRHLLPGHRCLPAP